MTTQRTHSSLRAGLLLAMAISLALSGCGGGDKAGEEGKAEETASAEGAKVGSPGTELEFAL